MFEAIRKRRAYAATDNIVVEYWIGDAFMGEEIDAAGEIPEIRAQLIGTDKFRELALIRNNRVIYTAKPDKKEVDFSYTDREPEAGTNFYYPARDPGERRDRLVFADLGEQEVGRAGRQITRVFHLPRRKSSQPTSAHVAPETMTA